MHTLRALLTSLSFTSAVASAQLAPVDGAEKPRDGRFAGEGTSVRALLDDGVPLPVPAVVVADALGDHVVAPASGDPFFLGFVAGKHYPPAGEALDPLLASSLLASFSDGRPTQQTYAFVMFEKRITPERERLLEDLGVRVLGTHPHHALQVALPVDVLDAVTALEFVRWVGVARPWQKVHPALLDAIADAGERPVDVYIDVFESDLNPGSSRTNEIVPRLIDSTGASEDGPVQPDAGTWMSNGWQQRALAALGVELVEYVDSIRAFRARMHGASLEQLVALDFVQFVEPDLEPSPLHDESMPMILADATRFSYDGDTNSAAIMGFADTGYYSQHYDLNGAWGVGFDLSNSTGPYVDGCGHGSHVLGTIRGEGDVIAGHRGGARGLGFSASGRIFAVRIFGDTCNWSGASISTILDRLDSSYNDGTFVTPRPHVVNHSWGTAGSWTGSEATPRTIDNSAYNNLQLHVWAAGNDGAGAGTINLEGTAKNVLTVGAVVDCLDSGPVDPGAIATFSSRGPCGDGRWKPNLVAPGDSITSVANHLPDTYTSKSGTSMAAPHVTAVAAQLVDHYSWLRYQPHQLASLLMATALTKDDLALSSSGNAHLDTYGAGRIEAYRAHWSTSQSQWVNTGWTQTSSNWVYGDFTISAGCTRVAVCMTYHEAAGSAGASTALVNDFDLYIDSPSGGIDPAGNVGEYIAQQSALDNTEIRMLNNPLVGAWRFKVWPEDVPSTARVSVTVVEVYGDTTPDGTLSLSASDMYVQPFENTTITATVTNPSFVASAVYLDSTSSSNQIVSTSTTLLDGVATDLTYNVQLGRDLLLGDIAHGSSRSARWITRWYNEGVQPWTVQARSDNWVDETQTLYVVVDGTPPNMVTNLASTTHAVGVQSCETSVNVTWTAAADGFSGVAGYVGVWDTSPFSTPTGAPNISGFDTSLATDIGSSTSARYFHIRAVDLCGNYATVVHLGPIYADANSVVSYCTGKTNSLGCVPTIGSSNAPSKSAGDFAVSCGQALNQKNGLLFWGWSPTATPFQGGYKCVASPTLRTDNVSSGGSPAGNDCTGRFSFVFDSAYLTTWSIDPGDTVYAQWWMRDPGSASTTGLSNAIQFTVCE